MTSQPGIDPDDAGDQKLTAVIGLAVIEAPSSTASDPVVDQGQSGPYQRIMTTLCGVGLGM